MVMALNLLIRNGIDRTNHARLDNLLRLYNDKNSNAVNQFFIDSTNPPDKLKNKELLDQLISLDSSYDRILAILQYDLKFPPEEARKAAEEIYKENQALYAHSRPDLFTAA